MCVFYLSVAVKYHDRGCCHETVMIEVDEDRIASMIEAGFPRDPRPRSSDIRGDVDDQKKVRAENSETVCKTRLLIK